MKIYKYTAFVLWHDSNEGKQEFSNTIARLEKLILVPNVSQIQIFEGKNNGRKLITLKKKIHA